MTNPNLPDLAEIDTALYNLQAERPRPLLEPSEVLPENLGGLHLLVTPAALERIIRAMADTRYADITDDLRRQQAEYNDPQRRALVRLAHAAYHDEGNVEIDAAAVVSLSEKDDAGRWASAYVQAWVYVEFGDLLPEPEGEEADDDDQS